MRNVYDLVQQGLKIGMLQHEEEVMGLASFVAAIKPKSFMEIGSWKGGLFYVLCNLAAGHGEKISVDLDAYGDLDCTMQERNATMATYAPNVHTINADSQLPSTFIAVKNILEGGFLDFLMIDGDHSYNGCRRDWCTYRQLVRSGGWIAFHDIVDSEKHRASHCFVGRVWEEIVGEKVEISAGREWGGVGLVRIP